MPLTESEKQALMRAFSFDEPEKPKLNFIKNEVVEINLEYRSDVENRKLLSLQV